MVRRITTMMIATMMVAGLATAVEKVSLDTEKSKIGFIGSKPDGKHDGGFKKFTANAVVDFEDPTGGSLRSLSIRPVCGPTMIG